LGSLKKLDEISTKKEIKILKNELNFLNKLLKNKNFLNKYIIEESNKTLSSIDKTKIQRLTTISSKDISNENINFDEFTEIEKITVVLTKEGSLKTFKDHLDELKLKKSLDNIISKQYILSNQKILLFTSSGRVYTIDPNLLPSGNSNAKNFILFVQSHSNERALKIISYQENLKCIVASKFGKGFIADLNEIQTTQKKGKQLFNLKNEDEFLYLSDKINPYIACVSKNSKLLIFETSELPVLKKGGGVQFQKIKEKDFLSDFQSFNLSDGIKWLIGSQLRIEKDIKFWIGKRSQTGKKIPKRFNKNLKFFNE